MPKVSTIQTDFSGGEFSPLLHGRVDIPRYQTGLETCLNFVPTIQGGLVRRSGTMYVSEVEDSSVKARLHEFEFSVTQAYVLEFSDQKIRFYRNQGQILESAQNITNITQADPAVVTISSHGYSDGDEIYIAGVVGMTELNGAFYKVAGATTNTFELQDRDGNDVDSSGFTAYSSGGTASKVYEITSPYLEADLFELKFTQSADVLYITHPDYAPRTLSRTSNTSWTLAAIDFLDGPYLGINNTTTTLTPAAVTGTGITVTASSTVGINNGDGFKSTDVGRWMRILLSSTWGWAKISAFNSTTSVDVDIESDFGSTSATTEWRLGAWSETTGYPSCVTFHEDRLVFGGAALTPQRIDCSQTGLYEVFGPTQTDGTVEADDALSFTFNSNDVNVVRWLLSIEKGLVAGTAGGEWLVRPSTQGEALTPTNITAKRSTTYGSANIQALQVGRAALFAQRAKRKIRELNYFFDADGYRATDITLLAEHITQTGVVEMTQQKEPQPVVWIVKEDGELIGVTYERSAEGFKAGWHRHVIGGVGDAGGSDADVESVAVIPSNDGSTNELWMIVKRHINGTTRRYVEILKDFFDDSTEQKDAFFVDSGLTYDVPVTISGATKADPVVVTANSHGFSNGDKVLITDVSGMTELNGNSYLVANVTTNTFEITDLDGNDIDGTAFTTYSSGGEVRKFVTTISGLSHLEGESVSILGDGAVIPNETVSNGSITLDTSATTVHIGLSYKSRAKLLRIDAGAADGTSIGKTRRIHRLSFMLHRSLGLKIGESFDDLTELTFRTTADSMTRAPSLFTGIRTESVDFSYDFNNNICLQKDDPLPLMLLAVMPQMITQDR